MQARVAAAAPAGWTHFFEASDYLPSDRKALLIQQLLPFLRSEEAWDRFLSKVALVGAAKEATALPLDFAAFADACGVPDVAEAVAHQPGDAIPCLSLAFHEARAAFPSACITPGACSRSPACSPGTLAALRPMQPRAPCSPAPHASRPWRITNAVQQASPEVCQ